MAKDVLFSDGKQRYETKGINQRLNIRYRLKLWEMIDSVKTNLELDYLQVFDLNYKKQPDQSYVQQIIHSQEVSEYSKVHTFSCTKDECIAGKIFVIDDGEYCTILWAEEY